MINRRHAAVFPIAGLSALMASCATAPPPAYTATEARIIDEFLDAYRARDVERAMALMAEDVYFEDPTMHLLARDRDELRNIVQQGADAFSDISITPFNRIHASPWTILQQRIAGTITRPDGRTRQVDVQGLSMFEIHEGKIARWYDYYDALSFRQQTR